MVWRAVTGQRGEGCSTGICTVANWDCFWRVLDHLTTMVANSLLGMKSALHR